ncbi:ATP-binding protein [Prosthecobacter sp.]|uniref:ATP-binding protein n=1 Tax=Prosthecobacter sp. TaxID=1965333 RepID=UPI0037844C11
MDPAYSVASSLNFLSGSGEMARRIREFDWAQHPLGPPHLWPNSLKVVVHLMLSSRFAMWMGWGPEFYFFCNDAYLPTLGIKRDTVLGQSATKVWEEIWADIGPRAESVVRTGEATWDESLLLFLERSGFAEETYHTFSYSPISHDDGSIGGMLCVVTEETERVIGERRLALLRDLGSDLSTIKSEEDVCSAVSSRLEERPQDMPFALIYLHSSDGKASHLASAHGAVAGSPLAPELICGESGEAWPLVEEFSQSASLLVDDLTSYGSSLPSKPWGQPPRSALLVPLAQQGQSQPAGFLVAGLNPFRPLDAAYRGFLDLFAGQIAAGLASARAYEAERKRAAALEEIDRAKTAFFSNVSHEFRTPLTLMLGPLAELVENASTGLPPAEHTLASVAHRNGMRLLKMVNSLLDFSRMEAGRVKARFEPTDISAYTAELASTFRSAIEKAGLRFVVECPPLSEPAYLDHEMWEKVVLNLLSNAFKFTLGGEIRIHVREFEDMFEMRVCDTGAGIPDEAKPHLFERFYRVQGVESRTHEGSGIGLALVNELVKTHGGSVAVESEAGRGSCFIVRLPHGSAHLPEDQCSTAPARHAGTHLARTFLAEAMRWLPNAEASENAAAQKDGTQDECDAQRPRIILADDNADMREYIARLLAERYEVFTVADGQAALDLAHEMRPDLVLTDVMMPRLDGFGLLSQMRASSELQSIPVIVLSARAGEESRVAGLEAGADDYLIKPFHARELLAKVSSTLKLARIRTEAAAREAALQEERTEILEGMNTAFMALDADYRIIYLNNEAARLYGLAPDKYLGLNHWEAFPATRGTVVETNYRRAMVERVALRFENFYEPWGQWFEINAYPISGGRLGIFFRDITDRKKQETLLREAKEAAELASQSKDRFLAVLSHELRTPLTPVLLAVAALEQEPGLRPEIREDLVMIKRNIELETKLIDDLLDLSRITSGKLSLMVNAVDLNDVVRQACRVCAPQILEKEIRLETQLDENVGMVAADSARLQQVFWNVLKNAIKFTPMKGVIHVSSMRRAEGCCEVRVADHGIGIPADRLPHVFNAFEQGGASITREFGGLGLGLAISKALVDLHHGTIRAESAGAGQGATFIIELPAKVLTTTARIRLSTPRQKAKLPPVRLLLVEDHADTARILSRQLSQAGASVALATTVESAIKASESEHFDILVSDLGLPDGTGYEIMRHVSAQGGMRGIAMSGFGMDEDRRRSREAGFAEHLVKPIDLRELIAAIQRTATESD